MQLNKDSFTTTEWDKITKCEKLINELLTSDTKFIVGSPSAKKLKEKHQAIKKYLKYLIDCPINPYFKTEVKQV